MTDNNAIDISKSERIQLELFKVMVQQQKLQLNAIDHQAGIWFEGLREKYNTPENVYTFDGARFTLKQNDTPVLPVREGEKVS